MTSRAAPAAVVRAMVFCALSLTLAAGHTAPRGGAAEPATPCAALQGHDLAAIPGAPARILSASRVASHGTLPAYCRVRGYIQPQIQFELRLPVAAWNGRYFQGGCGGFCGSVNIHRCNHALSRGFAVATHNMGHVSGQDGLWGSDHQLRRDYGRRSTHVTAVVVKAVTERFYGRRPSHSYFQGCSTGGREGLQLALHHPEDFDGIIAGDPAFPSRQGGIVNNWIAHHLNDPDGGEVFTDDALAALHAAVMEQCDAVDALADGVIEDPRNCEFDIRAVACPPGADRAGCLTPTQVEAAEQLYAGPRDGSGRRLYPGWVPLGSEKSWNGALNANYATQFLRYLAFPENPPASYTYREFDFDTDVNKLEAFAAVYDPVAPYEDPDMSAFRRAGGKLIVYHGWADATVSPMTSLDFYAEVTQREGGLEQVRAWYRLFMMPGMLHCRGGGVPDKVDWLSAIVDWVERGEAPDRLVAAQYADERGGDAPREVVRTRPLFPYPAVARYSGSGDVDDAANWAPAAPALEHEDDLEWLWDPR